MQTIRILSQGYLRHLTLLFSVLLIANLHYGLEVRAFQIGWKCHSLIRPLSTKNINCSPTSKETRLNDSPTNYIGNRKSFLFSSVKNIDSTEGENSNLDDDSYVDPLLNVDNVDSNSDQLILKHAFQQTAAQSTQVAIKTATATSFTISEREKELTTKVLNALLLISLFGFAVYSVVNVDGGMTRGWTMGEKAMRIPLDNWSSYESSLNSQPIVTKTTINVIIYLLGDWLSQTIFVNKNILEFDALRTLRNGLIGLVFGPLVHEYYEFSDWILPVDVPINRLYKIFMDQTIYLFVKCSVYITAVNMLAGESWEYSSEVAKSKIKGIMFTAWKFWPFVHAITYTAIPAQHRILWVNCVDLFWNAILALKTSSSTDSEIADNNPDIHEYDSKVPEIDMDGAHHQADDEKNGEIK